MASPDNRRDSCPAEIRAAVSAGLPPVPDDVRASLCPWEHLVPRDVESNIRWRRELLEACARDEEMRDAVREACGRDILFWVNSFVFTLDPRMPSPNVPMVTWPEQEDLILEMVRADGVHDLWIEKGRDLGVTWDAIIVFLWDCLYHDNTHHKMVSRKESLVDGSDDPDTLFSKIDHVLAFMPEFLKPRLSRSAMILSNQDNGSTITGDSTTSDIARGGRQKGMLIDEAATMDDLYEIVASTSAVCRSRFFVSTHRGISTPFNKLIRSGGKRVIRVDWRSRPSHRAGAYRAGADGRPVILDRSFRGVVHIDAESFVFPDSYPFIADGRLRSPYYDSQCARLGHNRIKIAEELDVDPSASRPCWFNDLPDRLEATTVRPPVFVGELEIDESRDIVTRLRPDPIGRLSLWFAMDVVSRPPNSRYVVGCDIGAGAGSSVSSAAVIDLCTGEYVAEWACSRTNPESFARIVTALRRWLSYRGTPAHVIWEINGPCGTGFGAVLMEIDPRNVYYRTGGKYSRNPGLLAPGFHSSLTTKAALFTDLRDAVASGRLAIPSAVTVGEMRNYRYGRMGEPVHDGSATEDPTSSKESHGDRVVAAALAWHVARDAVRNDEPRRDVEYMGATPAMHVREFARMERADDLLPGLWEHAI